VTTALVQDKTQLSVLHEFRGAGNITKHLQYRVKHITTSITASSQEPTRLLLVYYWLFQLIDIVRYRLHLLFE
jgi:hypothetical protein